ncbi:MAG: T9SS type A sorting domain-containing protein [Bacteroidota bacterium]
MKKITQCIIYSCFFAACTAFAGDGAPNILWEGRYEMPNKFFMTEYIIHTNDGGFLVNGSTGSGASLRGFVKTDGNGKQQWTKVLGNDSLSVYITHCSLLQNGDLDFIGSQSHFLSGQKVSWDYPFFMQSDVQKGITLKSFTDESAEEKLLGAPQVIKETDGSFTFLGIDEYNPTESNLYFRRIGTDTKKISEKEISLARFFDTSTAVKNVSPGYITKAPDGGYISFCSRATSTNRFGGVFIKLNSQGDIDFGKIFESEPEQLNYIRPKYAIATRDGGYALLHTSYMFYVPDQIKYTSVVTKLNGKGEVVWTRSIDKGNLTDIEMKYLVETKDGEILVAGSFSQMTKKSTTIVGTEDNLLVAFKANGEQLWEKQWGEPNVDERLEYIMEEPGGYVLAGAVGREYVRDLWLAKVQFSTTDVAENTVLKEKFTLSPNPAQSLSTIHYTLSTPANVKIEVIDALGNIIATPYSGFKTEGEYSVPFTTENIATGMYNVRLNINGKILTQNLSVVK